MSSPSARLLVIASVFFAGLACSAPGRAGEADGRVAADSSGIQGDTLTARADRNRMRGDTSAPVWVVMISDFQCPYCKRWHDESYARLLREYVATKKVRLAYVNFPLAIHANAIPAAEAAMCASLQDRFWDMHDALFGAQESWQGQANPMPVLGGIASKLRLDLTRWRDCMTRHSTRPLIDGDKQRSEGARVESTPTFFVGRTGRMVGAQPYDSLKALIEAHLRAAPKGR